MELIATEGHRLTQKVLKDGEQRQFFRRIYLAVSLTEDDFEEWTDEQKEAWEAEEHPTAEDIPAEEALDIITGRAEA